jgi:hypothetical protein
LKQFLGLKILKFFDADADPGSGTFLIRDPGGKNSDPESKNSYPGRKSRIRNTGGRME